MANLIGHRVFGRLSPWLSFQGAVSRQGRGFLSLSQRQLSTKSGGATQASELNSASATNPDVAPCFMRKSSALGQAAVLGAVIGSGFACILYNHVTSLSHWRWRDRIKGSWLEE